MTVNLIFFSLGISITKMRTCLNSRILYRFFYCMYVGLIGYITFISTFIKYLWFLPIWHGDGLNIHKNLIIDYLKPTLIIFIYIREYTKIAKLFFYSE